MPVLTFQNSDSIAIVLGRIPGGEIPCGGSRLRRIASAADRVCGGSRLRRIASAADRVCGGSHLRRIASAADRVCGASTTRPNSPNRSHASRGIPLDICAGSGGTRVVSHNATFLPLQLSIEDLVWSLVPLASRARWKSSSTLASSW
jgi:hypothetical protein